MAILVVIGQQASHHIAMDIKTDLSSPVYAIADGEIFAISLHGWDADGRNDNNVGVFVKHQLKNGNYFLALYGHLANWSVGNLHAGSNPTKLLAGQLFAAVGPFDGREHLHFGIHPSISLPLAGNGYGFGRMANNLWPNTNGFVDPIQFLYDNVPMSSNPGRDIMLADIRRVTRLDGRFGGVNDSTYGEYLDWDPNWELRWVDMVFLGRTITMYHATYKKGRNQRFYLFYNFSTSEWEGWNWCGD